MGHEYLGDKVDKVVKTYLSDGFAVLRNVIPHVMVNEIFRSTIEAVKAGCISNQKRDVHFLDGSEISSVHNLVDYIKCYSDVMSGTPIAEYARAIYGEISPDLINSSFFAKPKHCGLESPAHQDNAYFCMNPPEVMTCWFPVSFAGESNGGLYYYKGSGALGNVEHQPYGNLGTSMCIMEDKMRAISFSYEKVFISLEKGDCVIHNPLVIHGSEANSSDFDRPGYNFSIVSAMAVRDKGRFSDYQEKLDLFLKRKKPILT